MNVLGIDPGTGRMGFAVVKKEGGKILHVTHGCLETPSSTSHADRLVRIQEKLQQIIEEYRPELVGVEKLFFQNNAKTAMSVSEARGVILLTARQNNVRIVEHTPMQIKQAVTGHGGADKRQVQEMVKMLMRLQSIPKPDDAADAVAAAYCAAVTETMESVLNNVT